MMLAMPMGFRRKVEVFVKDEHLVIGFPKTVRVPIVDPKIHEFEYGRQDKNGQNDDLDRKLEPDKGDNDDAERRGDADDLDKVMKNEVAYLCARAGME